MTEYRTHLRRETTPPWRTERLLTECGKRLDDQGTLDGRQVWSRAEFSAFVRAQGVQRAVILTCQTCFSTAQRWKPWAQDPASAMDREASLARANEEHGDTLRHELLAIADLIERHPEEFAELVLARKGVVNLAQERQRRLREALR